jgi:hypothetical protein
LLDLQPRDRISHHLRRSGHPPLSPASASSAIEGTRPWEHECSGTSGALGLGPYTFLVERKPWATG